MPHCPTWLAWRSAARFTKWHRHALSTKVLPVAANIVPVQLKVLDPGLPVPAYEHSGDAGCDLIAAEDVVLQPGERRRVPTGIALSIPEGYAGFIHPRSGLSSKAGVTVINAPGTIDAGYRGEIQVPLVNLDPDATATISRGDRIAQLVIQEVSRAEFEIVDTLSTSDRGSAGFGSTGGFTHNEEQ